MRNYENIARYLVVFVLHRTGLAITIATGSGEGTYFKIAQDIKQSAEKEGIPIEVVSTGGSFDNINLLAAGKVDLAIMQLDVLRFVAEIMKKEAGLNVLQEAKVALNLYLEEIHVITKNPIRTLDQLQGRKVAVGPEKSGSAYGGSSPGRLRFASREGLRRFGGRGKDADQGTIDALMLVAGAPVPAFQKLDKHFRFVSLPADSGLEQIYPEKRIPASIYAWPASRIPTRCLRSS